MNNKGFTLIELLAVMLILGLISAIAYPNVTGIINDNKKEKVLEDSKALVSLAKYELTKNSNVRDSIDSEGIRYTLSEIDEKNTITVDPNGESYDRSTSYVKVYKQNSTIKYCVYLDSNNYSLSNNGNCVEYEGITGDNSKNYVEIK